MRTYWNENQGVFTGTVQDEPEFSHENHGGGLFPAASADFAAVRSGGHAAGAGEPDPTGASAHPRRGSADGGWGEIRSFNNRSGVGSRLVLTVLPGI